MRRCQRCGNEIRKGESLGQNVENFFALLLRQAEQVEAEDRELMEQKRYYGVEWRYNEPDDDYKNGTFFYFYTKKERDNWLKAPTQFSRKALRENEVPKAVRLHAFVRVNPFREKMK